MHLSDWTELSESSGEAAAFWAGEGVAGLRGCAPEEEKAKEGFI